MSSFLYTDIDKVKHSELVENMARFAESKGLQIFLLNLPKSDLNEETYIISDCFMLMSAEHRIALVNAGVSDYDFECYCEDVDDLISYLFSKYEYRTVMGRYREWSRPLLHRCHINELEDLEKFWNQLALTDRQSRKNADLLITLCTGSINDIKRVKKEVPETLLDQVKQKIQAFDTDQTRFIYQELDKKLVRIQGLSGTGKTELLLHKLKELYQSPEQYRIFVTCHNRILAESLSNRIPHFFNFMKVSQQIEWNKRLWCTNAWGGQSDSNSGLYKYICDFYDIPFYSFRQMGSFSLACRFAIKSIEDISNKNGHTYALDYIIVDECQDFSEDFFKLCQLVCSKKVYLAGDVFQSIFDDDISKNYEADYFLSKCYRTDNRTLMFAHALGLGLFEKKRLRWFSKEDWEACGYNYSDLEDGAKIELNREPVRRFIDVPDAYDCFSLVQFCDDEELCEQIISIIKNVMANNPTCSVDDFCIIMLDNNKDIYKTVNNIEYYIHKLLNWSVNKAYESKRKIENTLLISNRNNVKGLEYPFVICVSKKISSSYAYRNALYTMLTRSFLQTFLLLPNVKESLGEEVLRGYEEIMNDRKMTISVPTEAEIQEIETRFQAAKKVKPFSDLVNDIVSRLEIDKEKKQILIQKALTFDWQDLSIEDLEEHIKSLLIIL